MLRDRYEPMDLFALVPKLSLEMDPVLTELDHLLDDDVVFRRVRADLSRYHILEDVTPDHEDLPDSLQRHQQRFGRPPDLIAGDRGCYSPRNEELARQAGVKRVALPKLGRLSAEREKREKQRWFRRGMRFRTGSEGRISVLKRSYGLDCCLNHGEDGFGRWVGWGILTANLATISRTVVTRQAK